MRSNGLRAELPLVIRQRHLADRDLTGGAPRQHGRGAGGGQPVDRRVRHLAVIGEIAFAELIDAAALPDPAHHLVRDTELVEHVEAEQRDMRRPQHVAAGIEDDIGRRRARLGRAAEAGERLGRQLQPRQHAHAAAHRLELAAPPRLQRRAVMRPPGEAARHLHHEARVDAVRAGRDAIAAAAADLGPALRVVTARAAGDQVDDRRRRLARIGAGDAARLGHRAGAEAVAATRAGIGDFRAARPEQVEKPVCLVAVRHPSASLLCAEYDDSPSADAALRRMRERLMAGARNVPCVCCMAYLHRHAGIQTCYKLFTF